MKIDVKNYGGKITRRLKLPERGLVLVSSPNGIGKSAMLADAPLLALFGVVGKRGDPLRKGGEVDFELGDLRIIRARSKAGQPVRAAITLAGKQVDCDTATKADAWMEERFGPAELWQDLLVFSHANPSTYSCGTDAERKRLTELLVPTLAGFDAGLERCADRRRAHARATLAEAAAASAAAERAAALAEEELGRVLALPDTADDPAALRAEIGKLDARRAAIEARLEVLRRVAAETATSPQLAELELRATYATLRLQEARKNLAAVGVGTCPTCNRPMGDAEEREKTRAALAAAADEAREGAQREQLAVAELRGQLLADLRIRQAEARTEMGQLGQRHLAAGEAAAQLRARAARAEERERLGATEAQARRKLEEAQAAAAQAAAALAAEQREAQALELAEKMLGPRGARAGLLTRAFGVVEQLAAAKLARVWPGHRLQIARTTETLKGKVNEVTRVLGSRPDDVDDDLAEVARYSTGQLRRVDLALLLARRQVLAAADKNRLALPFLVVDEALNGLDDEGLTGCAELLAEEARDNLVVVLSHDEKLSRGIPFTAVLRLEETT